MYIINSKHNEAAELARPLPTFFDLMEVFTNESC